MEAKWLMATLLVGGLPLLLKTTSLQAGEDEGVAVKISITGPVCSGCLSKLDRRAKEVEGIVQLTIKEKEFAKKMCTAKLVLKKGAAVANVLAELSTKTGFKCETVKAEKDK